MVLKYSGSRGRHRNRQAPTHEADYSSEKGDYRDGNGYHIHCKHIEQNCFVKLILHWQADNSCGIFVGNLILISLPPINNASSRCFLDQMLSSSSLIQTLLRLRVIKLSFVVERPADSARTLKYGVGCRCGRWRSLRV